MIKPLIAWFRGDQAKDKAVKDKGEGDKSPNGPNLSDTTKDEISDEKGVR